MVKTISMTSLIRIMVVEDHPVFRDGLVAVIESQTDMVLVAKVGSAEEALIEYRKSRPDVVLMDRLLPGARGIDALVDIRREFPDARIIMIATTRHPRGH
jgi:DNA-binding NarL/FixJ family response regulator